MPRPEPTWISFEIDGREVRAPQGEHLADAAKRGDVEIPVFCYEPKLGAPVGACRMCLVEIEGMPKLQTACSTPVKDGMVVNTTSDNVRQAQNAIVEFLLINHPLDCPVCDKGGECPLQDISYGWGPGKSRYIEPKRHFKKPLELSPLVAIDRERCILCYRCVRFSQEISEDHQLVFLERGDHTFVGTHDGRPYVGPFSGNIVELCPVGALTSTAYRFRARPWDIEDAGSICTLCPSQCNITFTVRDDAKVMRVLARDNEEVDDGWLCDKGRFAYQAIAARERVTEPLARDGGALREVPWERALSEAVEGLRKAGERSAAIVGGGTTNEEGFLVQRMLREALGSPHVDSRPGGVLDPGHARALARPDLSARVSDIDYAGVVLVLDTELIDESPILDLRVRKAARRNGTRIVVASSRPSALDPNADAVVRFAPGAGDAVTAALAAGLGSERAGEDQLESLARAAGASADDVRVAVEELDAGGSAVVLWGERLGHGDRGAQGTDALLALAEALGTGDDGDSGLIEIPSGSNARGLREVGCLPNLGPGLADAEQSGRPAREIAATLGDGELSALVLLHSDPLLDLPERGAWEHALESAGVVVAFSDFLTEALADHADIVFPAESYAETEGTLTHPDGRLQRVRQAIPHPDRVEPAWRVLAVLCERLDAPVEARSAPMLSAEVFAAVPFYAGLTLAEIGGRGVRWQEREAASKLPDASPPDGPLTAPPELAPPGDGRLRLGAVPTLWSGHATEHALALRFLAPGQRAELSPADASRLGIASGDAVSVRATGGDAATIAATAAIRTGVPEGSVFLIAGTPADNATALMNGAARTVEVSPA
ncbi:MAG: NADH-quinone oxidoreductase subunit NuoG [Thermoleophilaceae bacterium]